MRLRIHNNFLVFLLVLSLGIFCCNGVLAAESNFFFGGARLFLLKIIKGIDYWFNGFLRYKELQEENNLLVFQNRSLKSLLIEYQDTKAENELLRDALQLTKNKGIKFVLANVVGRSPLNFSHTFVIDKGAVDGIEVGQAVIWNGKTLVGEVINTSKNFSTVRVLTDPEFKAAIFVGAQKSEGLFKGNGFLTPYIDLIPLKEEVEVGDIVYTSGLDQKFMRGLYLGEVSMCSAPEGKIFQDIKIKPAVDWTKLYQVLIIIDY